RNLTCRAMLGYARNERPITTARTRAALTNPTYQFARHSNMLKARSDPDGAAGRIVRKNHDRVPGAPIPDLVLRKRAPALRGDDDLLCSDGPVERHEYADRPVLAQKISVLIHLSARL